MNRMKMQFLACIENEVFARTSVVAFLMPLNLTMECIMEIKTLLAEAIVNSIIHGYEGVNDGMIDIEVMYDHENISIYVSDQGCGIEDIEIAKQPLYTSKEHLERSGMGLTIMETFADEFDIQSCINEGTSIHIVKRIPNETKKCE